MNTTKFFGNDEIACFKILERFRILKDVKEVAIEFGVPKKKVSQLLMANSFYPEIEKPLYLDTTAFDVQNQATSYWIGYLLGDGWVRWDEDKRHAEIGIGTKLEDYTHLVKFRDFVKSNHAITFKKHTLKNGKTYEYVEFRVSSKQLVLILMDYGIVPRKTYEFDGLADGFHTPDLIRGLWDADGSHNLYKYQSGNSFGRCAIGIYSQKLLRYFLDNTPVHFGTTRNGSSYLAQNTGPKSIQFLRWIYKHSIRDTRLDRKYKAYCKINNYYIGQYKILIPNSSQ